MTDLIYTDDMIAVCIKPAGVLSTDEPGGVPELVREALGDEGACVRTVHRLDRVVGGLMLLARTPECASELSRQVRERSFEKSYLAVAHGVPEQINGTFVDLLLRSKEERKTYVVKKPGKDVQEAILDYETLESRNDLSLVHIHLRTGRTHQIRCQFSARGMPLVGDRKYGNPEETCGIALWSFELSFTHPGTGEKMSFRHAPPETYPWNIFDMRFIKNQ